VNFVYANLPLAVLVSMVNSILLAFVLAPVTPVLHISLWVGLMAAVSAARLLCWYARRKDEYAADKSCGWSTIAVAGIAASGVAWGFLPLWLFPLHDPYLLFVALVVSGMSAGAATVHAAHLPSVAAFLLPALVPLGLNFLLGPTRLEVICGLMTAIFGVALYLAGSKFQRWFCDTTHARLALATHTRQINEANARLSAEVTRHQSTEAKLRHAQKMEAVGRLTAGIAHDFNNLLMAISGSAGLIANALGPGSAHSNRLSTIIQAANRGAVLTRQLLAFGRQQTLVPRKVDMNELLQGMEPLLSTTLGGYSKIQLHLDAKVATAFVDPTQIEHALLNLVINARDAMPFGGSVTIRTADATLPRPGVPADGPAGDFVMVSVSDTGTGMPESVRQKAFDPFFTTKEVGHGSGLGLSQVYGLVQQSGGVTEIESELGQGTTVCIYLPKAMAGADVPQEVVVPPPADCLADTARHAISRILLLDDDSQARETIAAMLRGVGHTVTSFSSAADALDELEGTKPFDLIIADYAMPDMRGDQFASRARPLRPGVPVLFVTGYAEPDALQTEPWLLKKPFDAALLQATIDQALHVAA